MIGFGSLASGAREFRRTMTIIFRLFAMVVSSMYLPERWKNISRFVISLFGTFHEDFPEFQNKDRSTVERLFFGSKKEMFFWVFTVT